MDDGPCLALSDYMEKYKNIPPETWPGYRDIDEKEAAPNLEMFKAFDDEIMDEGEEDFDEDESAS